jgi:hypothetical protein
MVKLIQSFCTDRKASVVEETSVHLIELEAIRMAIEGLSHENDRWCRSGSSLTVRVLYEAFNVQRLMIGRPNYEDQKGYR